MATRKKKFLDPKQSQFLALYLDPKSTTFGNAYQSAMSAGYKKEYAENLTGQMPMWLSENIGKDKMLLKAERNLDAFLDLEPERTTIKGGFENKRFNTEILKVKADITKFVASSVGKARYGSKDPESGNKTLIINITGETAQRYGLLKGKE